MTNRFPFIRLISGGFALVLRVAALSANRELVFPADAPQAGQALRINASDLTQLEWFTPGTGQGTGQITFSANPTSVFGVSGSPGDSITLSLNNQNANTVLAGPSSGGAAAPAFRALVEADIPALAASKVTSGVFDIGRIPVGTTSTTVAAGNDARFHNQNTDTGTTAQSFQLQSGSSGVRLKNNAGVLEARNAADSGFADFVCNNLTVQGTTTTVNSETLTIDDNIIVLNNNVTGTPTENAGIEIERGTPTNASLIWDESNDRWVAGLVGSELAIAQIYSQTFTSSDIASNTLTVSHNLNRQHPVYQVYDDNSQAIGVGGVGTSTNVLSLDFAHTTVSNTWRVVVYG